MKQMNQEIFSVVLIGTHIVALALGAFMGIYGRIHAARIHEAFMREEQRAGKHSFRSEGVDVERLADDSNVLNIDETRFFKRSKKV